MIVFEPELWGVSPLVPDGKSPTLKSAGAPAGGDATAAKSKDGLKLWDGGSFDFHDILDVINPLHHLPVINSIYRSEVKDEIGAVPRILGSMLYGGGVVGALIGAASAIVNIVVEHETGKDLGQHIYTAIFGEGAGTRRTTQVAAPKTGETGKTGEAAAAAANKAAEAKAAEAGNAGAQAAAAASTIAATPGAKPLTSKADAALQAFVAGLAKRASPAAAAAANAAIAKRSLRVTGAANAAAAAIAGKTAGSKSTAGAAPKGEVSTQFQRTDWYQHNQAILKAQAAALAKSQAAAGSKKSATSSSGDGGSSAAILQLFMNPSLVPGKPAKTAGAKPAASATTATTAAPAKPAAAKPAAANRGSVAGPWVANEIANGLAKYESLVKSRAANAGK
jgi:hypothetical protein